MMKKICQLQHLKAQRGLNCVIDKQKKLQRAGVKFEMNEGAYRKILDFCRQLTPELQEEDEGPHPTDAKVFFNLAKDIGSCDCGRGKRIGKNGPNNMIEWTAAHGSAAYGQVVDIIEEWSSKYSRQRKFHTAIVFRRTPKDHSVTCTALPGWIHIPISHSGPTCIPITPCLDFWGNPAKLSYPPSWIVIRSIMA